MTNQRIAKEIKGIIEHREWHADNAEKMTLEALSYLNSRKGQFGVERILKAVEKTNNKITDINKIINTVANDLAWGKLPVKIKPILSTRFYLK